MDTPFAKYCHLVRGETVYQINYDGDKLYNSQLLYFAHPDQSLSMSRFSFRAVFIDYYVDWVKTPQIWTKVPIFFYGHSNSDTLVTPFFYTTNGQIRADDLLEIDQTRFLATQIESVVGYYKVYVKPYESDQDIEIAKEKYIIRDYNVPSTDSTYTRTAKVLFHDENIALNLIPDVDQSSDITVAENRNFRTLYEWANLDISNLPFLIDIDSTLDLTGEMLLSD